MEHKEKEGKIVITVRHNKNDNGSVVKGALVEFHSRASLISDAESHGAGLEAESTSPGNKSKVQRKATLVASGVTDSKGQFCYTGPEGPISARATAYGLTPVSVNADIHVGCDSEACLYIPLALKIESYLLQDDCTSVPCNQFSEGSIVRFSASHDINYPDLKYHWEATGPINFLGVINENSVSAQLVGSGYYGVTLHCSGSAHASVTAGGTAAAAPVRAVKGDVRVTMRRAAAEPTADQGLWVAIRNRAKSISFERYDLFIKKLFCDDTTWEGLPDKISKLNPKPFIDARMSIHAADSYNVLKLATEVFLLMECGVVQKVGDKITLITPPDFKAIEESSRFGNTVTLSDIESRLKDYFGGTDKLPYLSRILKALLDLDPEDIKEKLPYCNAVLQSRFSCPSLIELIWSYFYEEAGLVQTLNAIAMRFQNRRGPSDRDPLANLELDALRPLNNLLWGYIQNEHNRLTLPRRAYEYDHHYGFTIYGKAVPTLRSADSRSKFLQGFNNLLYRTSLFYKDDADTTVIANGFPLLNALKETHIVLAEGAHNQFGDLPWTARVEMLIEQWLLARSEMKEFLRGRAMVPYREAWMGQVDSMKKLQGWTDTTVTHFSELSIFGEQIILSIRYGDWVDAFDENQAKNWARYWKPEIQSYIHAYRAVTGVDLMSEPVDSTPPGIHLQRLEGQKKSR